MKRRAPAELSNLVVPPVQLKRILRARWWQDFSPKQKCSLLAQPISEAVAETLEFISIYFDDSIIP